MPKTFKQYYRALLVKAGLFDEGAFRLALDEIRSDDTFICSFPKSGNTWIRFILARALVGHADLSFRTIDQLIPDTYSARDLANTAKSPRFLKVHTDWFRYFPRTVYCVRDFRDVIVSYYHYQVKLGEFKGDLEEYIRVFQDVQAFGSWGTHVCNAYEFKRNHPERIHIVRYEDLLRQPVTEIESLLSFCRINSKLGSSDIASACTFSNLRKLEEDKGSLFNDLSGGNFFRQGRSGSWKEELSDVHVRLLLEMPKTKEAMNLGGYEF